jgi:hypothetical protein
MQYKNFQQYVKSRLDSSEIAEIEKLAEIEMKFLRALQKDVFECKSVAMGGLEPPTPAL